MSANGGPAFPSEIDTEHYSAPSSYHVTGMTLRDYFAAKAFGVAHIELGGNDDGWLGTARLAYSIADAMLEARAE